MIHKKHCHDLKPIQNIRFSSRENVFFFSLAIWSAHQYIQKPSLQPPTFSYSILNSILTRYGCASAPVRREGGCRSGRQRLERRYRRQVRAKVVRWSHIVWGPHVMRGPHLMWGAQLAGWWADICKRKHQISGSGIFKYLLIGLVHTM